MIKSKVAVVTTGFLGLLSSSALAEGNDFTTDGKVTKFNRDGKVLGKVSSKDFKNNNIKTNGNFRGVFKNGYDVENVDYNNPVNSAVGLLHNEIDDNFYMGSGMFISPTVFVTVAHNFLQPNGVNKLHPNTTYYLTLGSNSKANFNNVTSGIKYLYPPQTIKFWNQDGFSLKPSEVEGNTRKSDGALVGGANIQWFNDLAVLTFDKPMQLMSPYKMAEFNELASDEEFNSIREGDKVNVLGYPSDFNKSDDPTLENKLEHGKLYKISGAIHGYIDPTTGKTYDKFTDKNGNLVDNPNKSVFYNYITSRGGLSGGGILNNKNHVIGLHQFALDGKYPEGHPKAGESVPDSDPTNKQAGGIIFTKEQRDWLRQIINQNKISGWYEDNNTHERYFFKDDGYMLRNTTKVIDGVTYRFDGFGVAKAQSEVAKKQGTIRVKYLNGSEEVLPSKVVSTGDVGTKYKYSTVNDNELMNLLQEGKYELVESLNEEGVLSEGEHVINVTVRLKTANLGEINQTIKSVEDFLVDKKEVSISHYLTNDYNNGIRDLKMLVRDTKNVVSNGTTQEVVNNMNKILSEKLNSMEQMARDMFQDFNAPRSELAREIASSIKQTRDVSNLSSDEVTKLEQLLKDVGAASSNMFNMDNYDFDLMDQNTKLAQKKLDELKAFDAKLSNLGAEQVEKDKLIKEWGTIKLDTIKGVSSNLETDELRNVKAQIGELSKDLNVFSSESLEVIKTKLVNKKLLSELIVKNNKLVDEILAKGSVVDKSDKKDNSSSTVDKSDKKDNNSSVVDKSDKKDESSVKDEASSNKKDNSSVKDESHSNEKDNSSVDAPKDNTDDKSHEGNKVDEKVKDNTPDHTVDSDSTRVGSDDKNEKEVTHGNKVGVGSKVDDDAKISQGNEGDDASKVVDKGNTTEDSKVGNVDKSRVGDKGDETSKVSNDGKSTHDNKVTNSSINLIDIIRSETPKIDKIEEVDFDINFDIKYTSRMTSNDINIQKIKDFNDKIPAKFTEADSNINFIKSFLSRLIKH